MIGRRLDLALPDVQFRREWTASCEPALPSVRPAGEGNVLDRLRAVQRAVVPDRTFANALHAQPEWALPKRHLSKPGLQPERCTEWGLPSEQSQRTISAQQPEWGVRGEQWSLECESRDRRKWDAQPERGHRPEWNACAVQWPAGDAERA